MNRIQAAELEDQLARAAAEKATLMDRVRELDRVMTKIDRQLYDYMWRAQKDKASAIAKDFKVGQRFRHPDHGTEKVIVKVGRTTVRYGHHGLPDGRFVDTDRAVLAQTLVAYGLELINP